MLAISTVSPAPRGPSQPEARYARLMARDDADEIVAELSPGDRWFWRSHTPRTPAIISAVLELDGDLSLAEARALIAERLHALERLRARVVERGWRAHWVRDDTFTVNHHVREAHLESDSLTSLWERVQELVAEPLDPTRSPWCFDLLQRPSRGCVVVARLHHALADGVALLMVLLALADPAPDIAARLGLATGENPLSDLFAGHPGATDGARRYLEQLMPAARQLLLRGHGVPDWLLPFAGAKGIASVARLALSRNDPPTFRGHRIAARRVAWSAGAPVDELKASSHTLEVTINDLLLAAVSGALRRYALRGGQFPADIRVGVPINLRTLEGMVGLGNQIGMMYVPLPLAAPTPAARLEEVRRRVARLKRSGQPFGAFATMSLMGVGPTWASRLLNEIVALKSRAVMTNVPGPVHALSFAGRRIDNLVFWVPTTGVGLGISVMSYAGQVRLGLMSAPTVVADPYTLATLFDEELAALRALA